MMHDTFQACKAASISVVVVAVAAIGISVAQDEAGKDLDPPAEEETKLRDEARKPRSIGSDSLHRFERLNGGAIGELFKSTVGDAIRSVVPLETANGRLVALATAISENGYALTKASELEQFRRSGSKQLIARLSSETTATVRLAAMQKENDLALVKIDARLRPIEWASAADLKTGFWISAIADRNRSIKVGIVSTPLRQIEREGGVVGIKILPRPQEGRGVLIWHVYEKSGASEVGLRSGDVILYVAGKPVKSPGDFTDIVTQFDANETVELVAERQVNGKPKKWAVEVMLGYRREVIDGIERNEVLSGASSRRKAGFQNVVQHDIPLGPEAMGGPLFTIEGKAIGLNIARRDRVTTFALPGELVERLSRDMIASATGRTLEVQVEDQLVP